MGGRLSGRIAFVTVSDGTLGDGRGESLAQALIGEGALVVLVAPDAGTGGRLAATLGAGAVFCSSDDAAADVSALVELADDLARQA